MRFDARCNRAIAAMTSETIHEKAVLEALLGDNSIEKGRKKHILEHVLNGRFFSQNLDRLNKEHL